MTPAWAEWVRAAWPSLVQGVEVPVPAELGHPRDAGFTAAPVAEDVGQIGDWVLPLDDGSRLHVHEFSGPAGRVLWAHLDRQDPGRGLVPAVRHVLGETRTGRFLLTQALGFGLGLAWGRWYAGRRS